MRTYTAEATIARSAERVWTYAADILRHPEWMNVTDARIVQGQGSQRGARGRERLVLGPFKWDVEFEVAEADPGRRIVWRSVDDAHVDLEMALELAPEGRAVTKATYHGTIQMKGVWRLLTPLVAMEGSSGIRKELQRLKEHVEAAPAVATAA